MRDGASHDGRDEAGHFGDGVGEAHQGPGVVGGDVGPIELSNFISSTICQIGSFNRCPFALSRKFRCGLYFYYNFVLLLSYVGLT